MATWRGDNDAGASWQTADGLERLRRGRRQFLAEAAGLTLLGAAGWGTAVSPVRAAGEQEGKQEKDGKSFLVTVHLIAFAPKEKVVLPEAEEQRRAMLKSLQPTFFKPPKNGAQWWIYREGLPPRLNPIEDLYPEVKPFIADLSATDAPRVEQALSLIDPRHVFRLVVSLSMSMPLNKLEAVHRPSKPVLIDPDDPKRRELRQLFYASLLRGVSADGFITIEDSATVVSINLNDLSRGIRGRTSIPGPHEVRLAYPVIYEFDNLAIEGHRVGGKLTFELTSGHILVKTIRKAD
ncbi:MAG: hypothetical protein NZT92_18115 [Abditibacteriales bacterium]|nr:hypothetical protein [Abditibacteriales bacterium]